jgi:hypothetical protein
LLTEKTPDRSYGQPASKKTRINQRNAAKTIRQNLGEAAKDEGKTRKAVAGSGAGAAKYFRQTVSVYFPVFKQYNRLLKSLPIKQAADFNIKLSGNI